MNKLNAMEGKTFVIRKLKEHLREAAKYYPVISVGGPRQAGKSTLLKQVFPEYKYISLEDPDTHKMVLSDVRGYLEENSNGLIIDEAQKMPVLFSFLQGIVDENRIPGRFVVSGSQNYLLHRGITQSLAGRIDISTLFPFDFEEMAPLESWNTSLENIMISGFYPGKLTENIPTKMFYKNYIKTYLERNVSDLINIGNLTTFRTFLSLVAYKSGSQLNFTDLSNDLNLTVNTVKAWISILESSYIIFMLPSFHKNMGKRLVKTPKVYFYDTGLLCHLLGLFDEAKLKASDKYGLVFENFIIAEKVKYKAHRQMDPDMFFFRDSNGLEVDLLERKEDGSVEMTEIKSGKTFKPEFLIPMKKLKALDSKLQMNLIYSGAQEAKLNDYQVKNWKYIHDEV
ncbi:MAG: ATP-binding protein [Saprospiraceae bacterium]|nr:ATP-binding protein [Saprospiraceae bacterium]